ncbi:MAG: hypothetical protein JST54_09835 [Deltaproteobacteria bacterium]|nr:hypothetical protein [Deltaproteobacteria bacterium]
MDERSVTQDMAFLDREFVSVVDKHFHVRLEHDLASVAKLDALFHDGPMRTIANDDFRNVSVMLAAYLGETVRALAHGGRWKLDETLGPCIVEVPHVAGTVRVLTRAQRRILSPDAQVLVPFISRAIALKN